MTTPGARPSEGEFDRADLVAATVLAVDGVVGLHGGMFGEAATYLPGRKVAGVRISEDGAQVHLTVGYGRPVHPLAEAVRRAVAPMVTGPVDVVVEDVSPEDVSPEDVSPGDARTADARTEDVTTTGSTA